MVQSNRITQQLEAAQAFLVVVLAEDTGSLTELQRAEALLRTALAYTEASHEQATILKPATSLPG